MTLSERISYFRQHRFVRDVAILQAGNFGSSFISGIAGIIIARILQPQLFGLYSLAFGLASLLVLIVSLGVQDSVTTIVSETHARGDRDATQEALLFLVKMTLGIAVFSVIAAWLAPTISNYFYHNREIGYFAGVLVIASLVSNTWFTFSTIGLQVSGKIKQMSLLGLSDQTIRSGISVALSLSGLSIAGAIYGNLYGSLVVCLISLVVWERLRRSETTFPSAMKLAKGFWKAGVRKYLRFSAWVALDKNIATLYTILPILMVGLYVSTTDVTYFKISFAYINLALSFMGPISTLLAVQFPRMKSGDQTHLKKNFLRVSLYSLLLSLLLTAGAILVSPFALKILYGQSFLPGLKYVFGLFIYGGFLGIGVGLGPMWRAINKVHISILVNLITLAIGVPAGLYMIAHWGVWGAVIMVSAWFTISHLISFFYLLTHLE